MYNLLFINNFLLTSTNYHLSSSLSSFVVLVKSLQCGLNVPSMTLQCSSVESFLFACPAKGGGPFLYSKINYYPKIISGHLQIMLFKGCLSFDDGKHAVDDFIADNIDGTHFGFSFLDSFLVIGF